MKEVIKEAREQVAVSTLTDSMCIVIHVPMVGLYKVGKVSDGYVATNLETCVYHMYQETIVGLMHALFGLHPDAQVWVCETSSDLAFLIEKYWGKVH